jgi:signal transduction histidine kinase
LEVRDNGRGFDVDAVEQKRYGLIGMRERSASVGAELQISSHPGETSVTLKWGAT